MDEPGVSNSYRYAILTLYAAGVILNAWFLIELVKESEDGREYVERVKHKILDPFRKGWEKYSLGFHSQMVIEEAETILRGVNNA